MEALAAADIGSVPLAALAKQNEELYLPGRADPVRLPERSAGLYLVQRIRDEAHRFALDYHRRLRSKSMRASRLDDISGLGEKRRTLLLRHFGSVKRIAQAQEEELVAAGLPRPVAKKVKDALGGG